MTDIKDLKEYWGKKYPGVLTVLWANPEGNRYYGRMLAAEKTIELAADTLGELIAQGEAFLRTVN